MPAHSFGSLQSFHEAFLPSQDDVREPSGRRDPAGTRHAVRIAGYRQSAENRQNQFRRDETSLGRSQGRREGEAGMGLLPPQDLSHH